MKNLFKLMLLFILAIPFQGCSDDDSFSSSKLPVTYYSISGVWDLFFQLKAVVLNEYLHSAFDNVNPKFLTRYRRPIQIHQDCLNVRG